MANFYSLYELSERIGAVVCGNGKRIVEGLSELNDCAPERLSFIGSLKLASTLPENIAVVADEKNFPDGRDGLKVKSFRMAMAALLAIFEPRWTLPVGISRGAFVDPAATVAPSAYVGPNCTVCAGARLGDGVKLIANVYVGPDVEIGDDSVLEPMVVLQRRTKVGARCLIHSCAVLGADGFGIIPGGPDGENIKIPQIGRVIVGDDVEIGAGTCVDRATIAATVVQSGAKVDNQVQIGHNCHVGKNCIIASQSGVAGSTTVEDGVIMGARCGLTGHIKVARGTQIAAMGIVMKNTKPGQILSGHPATDHMKDFRFKASLRRVPDMIKRLKKLEEDLAHEPIYAEKRN